MKAKMMVGSVAYLFGFFGAILLGMLSAAGMFEMGMIFTTLLILSGLVIGLLNVTRVEKVPLMVASLVIGVGSAGLASLDFVGIYFNAILSALALVITTAGVVVAVGVFMKRGK